MLSFLVDLADNSLGMRKLEMEVPASAWAALLLAHKLGFKVEAVKRAALISAGGFTDICVLAREGKRLP